MARAHEFGAPKNEGPIFGLKVNIKFQLIYIKKMIIFQRIISARSCGNMNGSMLDYARSIRLCYIY
jgi:hypothetical protein